MDLKEQLQIKIENYILNALAKEFLEAEIRINMANIPLTESDILAYDGVFSNLDDDDLWISLHEMNKKHNIDDELLFERYVDKLVEQCLASDSNPDNIKKISIYHVKPLSPDKWIYKLELAQTKDPNEVVDNDRWEKEFRPMMDNVIKTLEQICKRDNESEYRVIEKEVRERFPRLKANALVYFVSAEVFYRKFVKENALDYAPVLLEYCRSIETSLWDYICNSDIYREEAQRSIEFHKNNKTFGGAVYAIKQCPGGPLHKHSRHLDELVKLRNNSAHTFVSREPDVRRERNRIWDSDLLDILCDK